MKYTYLPLLILITSCFNQSNNDHSVYPGFFKDELGYKSNESVLTIFSEFSECGEWGGHEEYLKVLRKDSKSFELKYDKYDVDCDNMLKVFDGLGYIVRPEKKLILSKEIEITENGKQAILDFSIEMIKSKFNEKYVGNAGLIFSISNSDSTFFIQTYGGDSAHYLELKKALNLDQ